jgi:hypothetical protein
MDDDDNIPNPDAEGRIPYFDAPAGEEHPGQR